jgi:FlaG/FlaF family flagellin (archaellin)
MRTRTIACTSRATSMPCALWLLVAALSFLAATTRPFVCGISSMEPASLFSPGTPRKVRSRTAFNSLSSFFLTHIFSVQRCT